MAEFIVKIQTVTERTYRVSKVRTKSDAVYAVAQLPYDTDSFPENVDYQGEAIVGGPRVSAAGSVLTEAAEAKLVDVEADEPEPEPEPEPAGRRGRGAH